MWIITICKIKWLRYLLEINTNRTNDTRFGTETVNWIWVRSEQFYSIFWKWIPLMWGGSKKQWGGSKKISSRVLIPKEWILNFESTVKTIHCTNCHHNALHTKWPSHHHEIGANLHTVKKFNLCLCLQFNLCLCPIAVAVHLTIYHAFWIVHLDELPNQINLLR